MGNEFCDQGDQGDEGSLRLAATSRRSSADGVASSASPPSWLHAEDVGLFKEAAASLAATGIEVDQRHAFGLALLAETLAIYRRLAPAVRKRSIVDSVTQRKDACYQARGEVAEQLRRLMDDLGLLAPRASIVSAPKAAETEEERERARYVVA